MGSNSAPENRENKEDGLTGISKIFLVQQHLHPVKASALQISYIAMFTINGPNAHTSVLSTLSGFSEFLSHLKLMVNHVTRFCNNLDSYLIRYKSTEPIRHKTYLSYYSHEYEMCYETFTIELLVFKNLLLARLVSYNLIRKDRSVIPVQFTTSFVNYKLGLVDRDDIPLRELVTRGAGSDADC